MLCNSISHRIIRCLNKSDNSQYKYGKEWYQRAHTICQDISKDTNQPLDLVVKTLVILSPSNKWERNIIDVRNILNAYKNKQPLSSIKVCTFGSNKQKVINLLNGIHTELKGRKVNSFYDNIMYPHSSSKVTIDRWIMRVIHNEDKSPSNKEYDLIEKEFQRIANYVRLKPSELQAICWSVIRESNKK